MAKKTTTATAKKKASTKKASTTSRTRKTTKKTTRKTTKKVVAPSHDIIAERAWCLWMDSGCQPGQEEHNWFEAVAQLETELATC